MAQITVNDIIQDPSLLLGKKPDDIMEVIEQAQRIGWEVGTLRRGSQAGKGLVLREVKAGKYTARLIQWHPGGGHHGAKPYWKVSTPEHGIIRVGQQFGGQE